VVTPLNKETEGQRRLRSDECTEVALIFHGR
jgi:hypothetical protein